MLEAVQTGKIFPQAVTITQIPYGEDGIGVVVSAVHIVASQIIFGNWIVHPDLTVYVNQATLDTIITSKFQVVAELPASPTAEVFYFVKE